MDDNHWPSEWQRGVLDLCVLRILADDPAAIIDVPHFCNEAGHTFLSLEDETTHQVYLIRKGRIKAQG